MATTTLETPVAATANAPLATTTRQPWQPWQRVLFRIASPFFVLLSLPSDVGWYKNLVTIDWLHGHYRDWFARYDQPAAVPGRLSYFGLIRRYKGVDVLLQALTRKQLLVLERMTKGESNKQIAYNLDIAETTVKAHVSAILRKLNVHNPWRGMLLEYRTDAPPTTELGADEHAWRVGSAR